MGAAPCNFQFGFSVNAVNFEMLTLKSSAQNSVFSLAVSMSVLEWHFREKKGFKCYTEINYSRCFERVQFNAVSKLNIFPKISLIWSKHNDQSEQRNIWRKNSLSLNKSGSRSIKIHLSQSYPIPTPSGRNRPVKNVSLCHVKVSTLLLGINLNVSILSILLFKS